MRKYSFLCFIGAVLIFSSCGGSGKITVEENYIGYAQGTTFQIKYLVEEGVNFENDIDSIFEKVDESVNTYISSSIISVVNQGDTLVEIDKIFSYVLEKSLKLAKESDGMFDVSVGPLTELWGFGLSEKHHVDSANVDSVLNYVGYDSIFFKDSKVRLPKGFKIDFNSIAQGYTVDLIADYLESKKLENYMVEVGGEVRAKGVNSKGKVWRIGVDKPAESIDKSDRFQMIIELKDAALASSGNYRKFWVDEETGVRYAHTLNPKSGFPARNRLLGVSIISESGIDADAYATLCMIVGVEKSIELLRNNENLEGYLIYTDDRNEWEVYQTEGFKSYILN